MFFDFVYLQVITGGHYDVDMELTAPSGKILYKDVKKQYDSFTWTTDMKGVYKFCFSNEFSTFSHKVVYFDFQAGDEEPIVKGMDAHATAMTMVSNFRETNDASLKDLLVCCSPTDPLFYPRPKNILILFEFSIHSSYLPQNSVFLAHWRAFRLIGELIV